MYISNIEVFTTYFTIEAERSGGLFRFATVTNVLSMLSYTTYDHKKQPVKLTRYYGYRDGKFHFPISILDLVLNILDSAKSRYPGEFDYNIKYKQPNPVRHIENIEMQPGWKDRPEHQAAFEHLLSSTKHLVGNNLQTGKGKTYVGVKLFTIFKMPTLVICDGLTEQWRDNFLEKTTIPAERIYTIQGKPSIDKLLNKTIKSQYTEPDEYPWVIIGSMKTMRNWAFKEDQYADLPDLNEVMAGLGVGYAIYDEIHVNTRAAVKIMLTLNIDKNVILSATPMRATERENKIFNSIFPKGIIGGANVYDKYVIGTMYGYTLNTRRSDDYFVQYNYGYSHLKYEAILLKEKSLKTQFIDVLKKMLANEYFPYATITVDSDGEEVPTKCLIFVATVNMAIEVRNRLKSDYPERDIRTYLAKDPIDNLEAEIIVSTIKSCGVGKDISNLVTVINTISINSKPSYMQMLGRLRKLNNGIDCRFVDIINTTIQHCNRHAASKMAILKSCCKEFNEIGIPKFVARMAADKMTF